MIYVRWRLYRLVQWRFLHKASRVPLMTVSRRSNSSYLAICCIWLLLFDWDQPLETPWMATSVIRGSRSIHGSHCEPWRAVLFWPMIVHQLFKKVHLVGILQTMTGYEIYWKLESYYWNWCKFCNAKTSWRKRRNYQSTILVKTELYSN